MGNSSPVFITMIICYNKTWVKQDAFNCFQAEGNTHKNTEVLLSGFFQQLIERSHMADNIFKRLHKKPLPPLPLLQIACLQMLQQLHCRGHPAVKFYNSILYLGGGGGSLAIACILFWTSSENLSWGKISVTNPQSLASTAVSIRPASNISLD